MVENDGRDGRRRANGRQPQPAVGVLAYGVVNTTDDLGYVEDQPRHLRRHDVPIVAIRHGDEGVGVLDARFAQNVLIDAGADDRLPAEPGGKAAESTAVGVDDRHLIAGMIEEARHTGPDPPAAHDDRLHRWFGSSGAVRMTTTSHGALRRT